MGFLRAPQTFIIKHDHSPPSYTPSMALLPPLHHTPNPGTTRRTGSDLPILRLRATTVPPRAGRSSPDPPTPGPSLHEKGRGRREPVGNTRPRPWLDVDEGVRRLARAIAAAAVATAMLCLDPRVAAEASVGEGRGGFHPLPCADVAGYYSGLDGLEGAALMRRLGAIVSVHRSLAYKEVWDALKILDAADPIDPEHSSENRDLLLESCTEIVGRETQGMEQPFILNNAPAWQPLPLRSVMVHKIHVASPHRVVLPLPSFFAGEHLWPRSYGLMDKPSLTDLHNLRPADVNVNSSRGNKYFGECFPESNECLRPANTEAAPDTETDSKRWAPPLQVRGDVARSLMYMAVCYGFHQPGGGLHLQLSDSPNIKNREMGLLSALLEWNELDPPSEAEKLRNERICRLYQHNRNPFTDHPEYANLIWKEPTTRRKTYKVSSKAWINEFHYDNKGNDQNEFVEIVADSSLEANNLWLLLYNGSTGKVYKSLLVGASQAFTVSNSISRFLIYTAFMPLQNGPDGIALALVGDDDQSKVIQFLSYEGTFKAIYGPARGKESVDVNVQETLTSSEHDSLGLTGTTRGELVWKKFEGAATPGKSNVGLRL